MLVVHFSTTPSQEEQQAYIHFVDFLDACEGVKEAAIYIHDSILHTCTDGDMKCSLEDVLLFFSGASTVPPLGFPLKPSFRFLYGEESRLAIASTCDLVLRIPTCHGKRVCSIWMELSILSNEFFERV